MRQTSGEVRRTYSMLFVAGNLWLAATGLSGLRPLVSFVSSPLFPLSPSLISLSFCSATSPIEHIRAGILGFSHSLAILPIVVDIARAQKDDDARRVFLIAEEANGGRWRQVGGIVL